MKPWILAIFATLIAALSAGKKDNRLLPRLLYMKQSDQCRNHFNDEICTSEDYLDFSINDKMNLEGNSYDTNDSPNNQMINNFIPNELQTNTNKRGGNIISQGCDCQKTNAIIDLGHSHFPRYLINAVCQDDDDKKHQSKKCWHGAKCKPVEYKVHVLTYRTQTDILERDILASQLPDVLRPYWKFKMVSVATGCYCTY